MQTHYIEIFKKLAMLLMVVSGSFLFSLSFPPSVKAAAPNRSVPYDEAALCASSAVFFCEDWEADDIVIPKGSGGNDNTCIMRNPGLYNKNGGQPRNASCSTAQGGTIQHPFQNLPLGPDTTTANKVWRIAKGGKSFTDIVTGVNTGFGQGSYGGFLRGTDGSGISGVREYYVRYQYYYSDNYDFPEQVDSKQLLTQPLNFLDNPSASYQNGTYINRRRPCSLPNPIENLFSIRRSTLYAYWPGLKDACPPAPVGTKIPGQLFLWDTQKWHTIEFYVKLESKFNGSANDGHVKLWIDDVLTYDSTTMPGWNGDTCEDPCEGLGFFFAGAYMNPQDAPHNGFAEMDNLVMSRKKIGLPKGGTSTPTKDTTPPSNPSGLSLKLNSSSTP